MAAIALVLIQFMRIKNHTQQLERLDNEIST